MQVHNGVEDETCFTISIDVWILHMKLNDVGDLLKHGIIS